MVRTFTLFLGVLGGEGKKSINWKEEKRRKNIITFIPEEKVTLYPPGLWVGKKGREKMIFENPVVFYE